MIVTSWSILNEIILTGESDISFDIKLPTIFIHAKKAFNAMLLIREALYKEYDIFQIYNHEHKRIRLNKTGMELSKIQTFVDLQGLEQFDFMVPE